MWNNKKELVYEEIAYANKLYCEQQLKVAKEKYIEDLLFNNFVDKIKTNISRYDYCESQIREAQNELHNKGRKPNLRNFEKLLSEDFFSGNLITIKDIVSGGYETYYWNITFNLNSEEYVLQIPVLNNINTKNIIYANFGLFTLYKMEGTCTMKSVVESYKTKDVENYIKTLLGE